MISEKYQMETVRYILTFPVDPTERGTRDVCVQRENVHHMMTCVGCFFFSLFEHLKQEVVEYFMSISL